MRRQFGGKGADQLAGGSGADVFKYISALDSTPAIHDTILDFNATGGQHDFIAFQNLALTTFDGALAGTTLAAGHFGWLGMFVGYDMPASSALTQGRLGWQPVQTAGMIEDLDRMDWSAA